MRRFALPVEATHTTEHQIVLTLLLSSNRRIVSTDYPSGPQTRQRSACIEVHEYRRPTDAIRSPASREATHPLAPGFQRRPRAGDGTGPYSLSTYASLRRGYIRRGHWLGGTALRSATRDSRKMPPSITAPGKSAVMRPPPDHCPALSRIARTSTHTTESISAMSVRLLGAIGCRDFAAATSGMALKRG